MSIAKNIAALRAALPAGVTLVAVSKTRPADDVMEAWRAGQLDFGENRPQEMAAKQAALAALPSPPVGIRWHQIGHLQTNKVRLIIPFVAMIHSVDSARLACEISRRAVEAGRVVDVLLEILVAREESKEGWAWDELLAWLDGGQCRSLAGVRFRGVMGVATFTDDESMVRAEFEALAAMHAELRERFFGAQFDTLSMGMSDDYPLALDAGSTMVRIGSMIFGRRF
ncbi:MAG: YggS family pyridoxal phosphate-dependent enzyme [Alistipes sp.]|jgi:pyridoxal phosphate enzyme (YggS family)|nr:YggS family pyridoxal phosphate-dependent enzyme [Alistipes sp.]